MLYSSLSRHATNSYFFFFNDTATTEIYTLSLHDALPIWTVPSSGAGRATDCQSIRAVPVAGRSEEHTSELQSRPHLVCRLLLEKKKKATKTRALHLALQHRTRCLLLP